MLEFLYGAPFGTGGYPALDDAAAWLASAESIDTTFG